MRIQIRRFAELRVSPILDCKIDWTIAVEGTALEIQHQDIHNGKTRIVISTYFNEAPLLNSRSGYVQIDQINLKQLEATIETFANVLAISQASRVEIVSPNPWIVLEPKDQSTWKWVDGHIGIGSFFRHEPHTDLRVPCQILADLADDRPDGLALLAEAFEHVHPTGQLHELMRVFELAFGLASSHLVGPLGAYLSALPYGYTVDEVRTWITEIRHQATHADLTRQSKFILASDVRPILARVRQAAVEVVVNKEVWHDTSLDRRVRWQPAEYLKADQSLALTLGTTPRIYFQVLDGTGAYPTSLTQEMHFPPGVCWWGIPEAINIPCKVEN